MPAMARDVIITGCGRGGTSLVAGTIAGGDGDYYMGEHLVEPREANPRGFFESRQINAINESIMEPAVDLSDGQPQRKQLWLATLDDVSTLAASSAAEQQMAEATARHPFCFKDPRFAWTLDVWRPFLIDTVFIGVFRDPAATAASIVKEAATAPYLANLSMNMDQALAVWTNIYDHLLRRDRQRWLFIHADQLFTSDGLNRLEAHIDTTVDRDFPEPGLQRSQSDHTLPDHTAALYQRLCELAGYAQ